MDTFYKALNSNIKPTVDNAADSAFMNYTFMEVEEILDRLMKNKRAWHTRNFENKQYVFSGNVRGTMPKRIRS